MTPLNRNTKTNNIIFTKKVELINSDSEQNEINNLSSDNYIYLAAESQTLMNEWVNNFNFVSKMK